MLQPGDVLVMNNSKVLPARLYGAKTTGAACEFLMLKQVQHDVWECMARPGKRLQPGHVVVFGQGVLKGEILESLENGNKLVKFTYDTQTLFEALDIVGKLPLPHYITEELKDGSLYQTEYAKILGSSAAPTAGLHFTQELMAKLEAKGVIIKYITLHVGLGTFRPVKVDDIENHKMHSEFYILDEENAKIINTAKENGKRVIAVGTTSSRTLETIAQNGRVEAKSGWTDIFIYPPYQFKIVDALITNFHLSESTLLMLVSSLSSREIMLGAYNEAIEKKYRFFSFGDAMLIE